jgi:Flp pilus assembly pilin Flp
MEGQDFAEYALFIGFIAVVVFVAASLLGDNLHQYLDVLVQAINAWG